MKTALVPFGGDDEVDASVEYVALPPCCEDSLTLRNYAEYGAHLQLIHGFRR